MKEANEFAQVLFFEHNYVAAHKRASKSFRDNVSVDDLKQYVEKMESKFGELIALEVTSYSLEADNAINIFYVADSGSVLSYHQIGLVGNKRDGYKVVGLHNYNEPYSSDADNYKFRHKYAVYKLEDQ